MFSDFDINAYTFVSQNSVKIQGTFDHVEVFLAVPAGVVLTSSG